jgi:hypothetical protein
VSERQGFAQGRSPQLQAVEVLRRSGRLTCVRSWIEETHVKHNVSIQKASELPLRLKSAVEQLLGRPIDADEEVSIGAVPPQQIAPSAIDDAVDHLRHRIVLDTNILVRANAKARGPTRELLQLIVGSRDQVLLLSPFLQQELERVFSYERVRASSKLTDGEIIDYLSYGPF